MPEGNIGNKYKTIEEADKGIAELEKTLGTIQSERDTLKNQIAELSKPKAPAFADDSGFEKHAAGKINAADVFKKAIVEKVYDPNDMTKIGEVLKDADPKWLGETFAKFRVVTAIADIEKAQASQVKKYGEERFKQMLDWHQKNAKDDEKQAFGARWNNPNEAENAAKQLFADFTLSQTTRSPAETATTSTGGGAGGFTSPAELKQAREASKRLYGIDYFKNDPEFQRRLQLTPESVKSVVI